MENELNVLQGNLFIIESERDQARLEVSEKQMKILELNQQLENAIHILRFYQEDDSDRWIIVKVNKFLRDYDEWRRGFEL